MLIYYKLTKKSSIVIIGGLKYGTLTTNLASQKSFNLIGLIRKDFAFQIETLATLKFTFLQFYARLLNPLYKNLLQIFIFR